MSNMRQTLQFVEKRINDGALEAHAAVDKYAFAVASGKEKEAEELRDKILMLQGELLDNISAKVMLMRKLGMRVLP